MKASISKWRILGYLLLSVCFLLFSSSSSATANTTLTLRINSAASIVHTSGGFSGKGMGDLSISGMFQVVVTDGVITFHNINVTTNPATYPDPGTAIVPTYSGTATQTGAAFSFSGSKPYDKATDGGDFSGAINDIGFSMNGNFISPCCDQYNYQFVLNGTIVCDDDNACTTDTFDPSTGTCIHTPTAVCIDTYNNNFTMLDASGALVGGANDVHFTWDGTKKTSVECSQVPNATLSSSTPFLGLTWSTHDVAIYGPGTYTVYTGCPAGCPNCGIGTPITFTVGDNEIGGHILFDWNTTKNFNMVNVWTPKAAFEPSPMWTDASGSNPADKVWDWMSKDLDGDGINGMMMPEGGILPATIHI
jgi:hypothetical protein